MAVVKIAYRWSNNIVGAVGQGGKLPDYFGPFEEMKDKILADSDSNTEFRLVRHGPGHDVVTKDEWLLPGGIDKVTPHNVETIRARLAAGHSPEQIGQDHGIHPQIIRMIADKRVWHGEFSPTITFHH